MPYHWPEDDLALKRKPWRWWAFIRRVTCSVAGSGFWIEHLRELWPTVY